MSLKSGLRRLAPRKVRPYRILRGPLKGRTIVTSLHDYPGAILGRTEAPLLEWFGKNARSGEVWLDVGAHYGYTAIALAELVGRDGRVYAFEPSLATAGYLNITRLLNRLPQIKVVPIGLGESGSLRSASVAIDRGMANHQFGGPGVDEIYLMGFDQIWASIGADRLDGAKIDVQGMEAAVLSGMSSALAKYKPTLAIEFHAGVDRMGILQLLQAVGYQLPGTAIGPVAGHPTTIYEDNRSYAFRAGS